MTTAAWRPFRHVRLACRGLATCSGHIRTAIYATYPLHARLSKNPHNVLTAARSPWPRSTVAQQTRSLMGLQWTRDHWLGWRKMMTPPNLPEFKEAMESLECDYRKFYGEVPQMQRDRDGNEVPLEEEEIYALANMTAEMRHQMIWSDDQKAVIDKCAGPHLLMCNFFHKKAQFLEALAGPLQIAALRQSGIPGLVVVTKKLTCMGEEVDVPDMEATVKASRLSEADQKRVLTYCESDEVDLNTREITATIAVWKGYLARAIDPDFWTVRSPEPFRMTHLDFGILNDDKLFAGLDQERPASAYDSDGKKRKLSMAEQLRFSIDTVVGESKEKLAEPELSRERRESIHRQFKDLLVTLIEQEQRILVSGAAGQIAALKQSGMSGLVIRTKLITFEGNEHEIVDMDEMLCASRLNDHDRARLPTYFESDEVDRQVRDDAEYLAAIRHGISLAREQIESSRAA